MNIINKIFISLCLLFFTNHLAKAQSGKPSHPNIFLIMADDLGWNDVGYHGSVIKTPCLDQLAEAGVELDQHYVHPQCTPTRIGLLTGRQCSRFGIVRPVNIQCLPWNTETLASALKKTGYATGIFGKWHLGSKPEWGPNHYGFDYSYGSLPGAVHPWSHLYRKGQYMHGWHRNHEPVDEEGMHTDLCTNEAIKWLEQVEEEKPWLLYFPMQAVHTPVDAPVEYKQMYHDKQYFQDPKKNESFVRYAAMTTHMDASIGKIIDYLEEKGQLENTLIIFFSDNGAVELEPGNSSGAAYQGAPELPSWQLGSNDPLRGQKATMYEGGIRTPALAYWKGKLAPAKITTPLSVVDWMPTLLQLAGYEPPRDLGLDGLDIWPLLSGKAKILEERAIYIRYIGGMYAIRKGDWKLIKMGNSSFAKKRMPGDDRSDQLYNLKQDPFEKENLARQHPEIVKELNEIIDREKTKDMPLRDPFVEVFR